MSWNLIPVWRDQEMGPLESNWVTKRHPSWMQLCCYKGSSREIPFRLVKLQPGTRRQALTRHICRVLILGFPAPHTVRYGMSIICQPCSLRSCVIVFWQTLKRPVFNRRWDQSEQIGFILYHNPKLLVVETQGPCWESEAKLIQWWGEPGRGPGEGGELDKF